VGGNAARCQIKKTTEKMKSKRVDNLTLTNWINVAKRMTARAAALKDYCITNKHNRQMREIAREWMAGRGYIIATVKDLHERYGTLSHYDVNAPGADVLTVWAIDWNDFYKRLQFAPIR